MQRYSANLILLPFYTQRSIASQKICLRYVSDMSWGRIVSSEKWRVWLGASASCGQLSSDGDHSFVRIVDQEPVFYLYVSDMHTYVLLHITTVPVGF